MRVPRYLCVLILASLPACCFSAADGGNESTFPIPPAVVPTSPPEGSFAPQSQFTIPGPLRSFLRMAGISQKIPADEVLPLLSRNVFMQGYQSSKKTEFLILLSRYVVQARELSLLVESDGKIHVSNCDDAKRLLTILGYRTRPNCGEPGMSLQTADPERAFLTIDSGFPLPELEQALQAGTPFEYSYAASPVPVLFAAGDWTMASDKNYNESSKDLVDTILSDPALARLYWALSKLDPGTVKLLQQSIGLRKLLPYAAVLDFYGSRISIRDGRVIVPGGREAEPAWKDLIGVSPASPAAFVQRLLAGDKGWLAAYFDALSSVSRLRQAYFTEPHRLQLFYQALRSKRHSASATTGLLRPSPGLLILVTCLQLEPNGEPMVPGNIEVWREILSQKIDSHEANDLDKHNGHLSGSDRLVQSMFALCRQSTDSGPLQIYMAISAIDGQRLPGQRLAPATVSLLAQKFEEFKDQYRIFGEFRGLSDSSIVLFLETADALNKVPINVRADALGTFQANVGIWQILARQGQIADSQLNVSWEEMVKPFAKVRSPAQLYDAGRISLVQLFRFTSGGTKLSQDEIIEALAGPRQSTPDGIRAHREVANRIRSVLDGQRLISLDTLLVLGDALTEKAQGKTLDNFVIRKAGEIHEFEMPRPIFTETEKTEWAAGIYNNHHTNVEMRTDLAKILKSPSPTPAQLEESRGQLAPFLRDTLVGLNYAYYEPPGAQALHNNPLLVRSHDFAGETLGGLKTIWQTPELLGQGSPAGGGAHFVGSLADLPYVLADLEQDFITPENVQALIWKELTPVLLTSAILPRWWNISQKELHAVALYQRSGEELLNFSATDEDLRNKVITILSDRVNPRRSVQVEQGLLAGAASQVVSQLSPADTFYLTAEFHRRYPDKTGAWGPATQELQTLFRQQPEEVNWKRLSHDFGVPHPILAQSYGSELMNVGPLPTYVGYSSRLLAESWDSPNLYWARLVDESGMSAVTLNKLAPQLTRSMVEKIFATDLEDWEALVRAMHETAEEFRNGKIASLTTSAGALP